MTIKISYKEKNLIFSLQKSDIRTWTNLGGQTFDFSLHTRLLHGGDLRGVGFQQVEEGGLVLPEKQDDLPGATNKLAVHPTRRLRGIVVDDAVSFGHGEALGGVLANQQDSRLAIAEISEHLNFRLTSL